MVYNPNKGNTSLHQNGKSWNQKTNAKALRKAKKDAKDDYPVFCSGINCALSLPLRAFVCVVNPLFNSLSGNQ
jgi:hypothetical protein